MLSGPCHSDIKYKIFYCVKFYTYDGPDALIADFLNRLAASRFRDFCHDSMLSGLICAGDWARKWWFGADHSGAVTPGQKIVIRF